MKLLADKAGPALRSIANRLLTEHEVKLSPAQLARMALAQFVEDDRINFQSRKDLFEFAERASAEMINRIAKEGVALPGNSPAFKSLRSVFRTDAAKQHPVVLSQALRAVAALDGGLGRLLYLRYVLCLDAAQAAQWLELAESEILQSWEQAQNLLLRTSAFVTELGLAGEDSLDALPQTANRNFDSLSSAHWPDELDSSAPPAELEVLRAANADLLARLQEEKKRVVELEAQVSLESSRSGTQEAVGTLLNQPSLASVPLLDGSSLEELFEQFGANYGRWLRHFGAAEDAVSLDRIRQHDPKGVKKLEQKISKARKRERDDTGTAQTPTLGQIVPKESDRGDQELAGKTTEEILANERLGRLLYGRLRRHLFGR